MELSLISPLQFQLNGARTSFPCSLQLLKSRCTLKCYCGEQVRMSAIQRICDKLRREGHVDAEEDNGDNKLRLGAGEIFIPNPNELLKEGKRVGHSLEPKTRGGLPALAEMVLPAEEVKRLTTSGLGIPNINTLKIGKAGVTQGIIHNIHQRWKNSEVIRIKCDDLSRSNMRTTHRLLEMKTGGIVVWRAGSIIILYRGTNYEPHCVRVGRSLGITLKPPSAMIHAVDREDGDPSVDSPNKSNLTGLVNGGEPTRSFVNPETTFSEKDCMLATPSMEYEREFDSLLDGLGPRFTDWRGYDPLPVDADLLPAAVLGYKKPLRVLPYGMKPKLTDNEMTRLRRLGRPLPPHFALGINAHLQGLAAAMVKLWERSEIAKIAVKQGVQNSDSEKMAEELKRLTGGSLLSRDREFIVFYRGKDFLPSIGAVLEEKKAMEKVSQKKYEIEQFKEISPTLSHDEAVPVESNIEIQFARAGNRWIHSEEQRKIREAEYRVKKFAAARKLDSKVKLALRKNNEVENEINDMGMVLDPANKDTITEEERFMLRKLGLRMKPFLLLGRRGVFDGVIENMHLHWKYRDLVKIISKEKSIAQVTDTARILANESGGILVAVETVSKGHAIIVYRGKNYRRPTVLRPKSLLTKNAAYKRSIDVQRRESLNLDTLQLERSIEQMKSHLRKEEDRDDTSELLMTKELDARAAYLSEVEDRISMQSTAKLVCASSTRDEEIAVHLTKELNSIDPDNSTSEHDATYLDHSDSDSEKEDSLSILQIGKSATNSQKTSTDALEHNNIKSKMPEIFHRAEPLSNKQRLVLRRQALQMEKIARFHVGKSNVLSGLAKSIRSYFEKHALVIVAVKGRARGTSIQEIAFKLEEATGGVLVSQEPAKLILYRGWPEGEENPSYDKESKESQDIAPELMTAIWKECGL